MQIKGYVRSYLGGALTYAKGGGTIVVTGPGNQEWRIPVKLDDTGNFYHKFDARDAGDRRLHASSSSRTAQPAEERKPTIRTKTPRAVATQRQPTTTG